MVFERFTDRARRVLVLAQEEARLLNHGGIDSEHLLIGLIHENEAVAAKALQALGLTLDGLRVQVELLHPSLTKPGAKAGLVQDFTERGKKVCELALREALQLGYNYIAPEHLLLAVVREGEGVGAQALVNAGLSLDAVRRKVIELLCGSRTETAGSSSDATQFVDGQSDSIRWSIEKVRDKSGRNRQPAVAFGTDESKRYVVKFVDGAQTDVEANRVYVASDCIVLLQTGNFRGLFALDAVRSIVLEDAQ